LGFNLAQHLQIHEHDFGQDLSVPQLAVFLREPVLLSQQVLVPRISPTLQRLTNDGSLPIRRLTTALIRSGYFGDFAPQTGTDGSRIAEPRSLR
jgi:hypothetical protein